MSKHLHRDLHTTSVIQQRNQTRSTNTTCQAAAAAALPVFMATNGQHWIARWSLPKLHKARPHAIWSFLDAWSFTQVRNLINIFNISTFFPISQVLRQDHHLSTVLRSSNAQRHAKTIFCCTNWLGPQPWGSAKQLSIWRELALRQWPFVTDLNRSCRLTKLIQSVASEETTWTYFKGIPFFLTHKPFFLTHTPFFWPTTPFFWPPTHFFWPPTLFFWPPTFFSDPPPFL